MFTIVTDSAGNEVELVNSMFEGEMTRDRLLEGTSNRLRRRLLSMDEEDLEFHLTACPVLWSPEHWKDQPNPAFARVGRFDRLRIGDREVRYTFRAYDGFKPIRHLDLYDQDSYFRRGEYGWHRSTIQVREEDLFEVLGNELVLDPPVVEELPETPALFNIEPKRHDKLVCVMMPFTIPRIEPVYAKIDRSLSELRVNCERANTDLSARRIIDKVATLIYHADAVICDFTGTNVNVFYEAGLAHAWSKTTIFIAEEGTPLPFDTRDEDTIFYENTDLGLKNLWYKILDRLQARTDLFPAETV